MRPGRIPISTNMCSVCWTKKAAMYQRECGHVCMCKKCSGLVIDTKNLCSLCPMCRTPMFTELMRIKSVTRCSCRS